nr:hypothetical protein [uncultured Desulfobacter sp.]
MFSPVIKDEEVASPLTGRDIIVMVEQAPDRDDRRSTNDYFMG